MSPRMTAARLSLLHAVKQGHVTYWPTNGSQEAWSCWESLGGGLKVTARIGKLETQGWIYRETEPSNGWGYRWRLTPAGRAVLAQHEGGTS